METMLGYALAADKPAVWATLPCNRCLLRIHTIVSLGSDGDTGISPDRPSIILTVTYKLNE